MSEAEISAQDSVERTKAVCLVCFVLALMFPGLAVQPQPFAPFALGAGALFSLSQCALVTCGLQDCRVCIRMCHRRPRHIRCLHDARGSDSREIAVTHVLMQRWACATFTRLCRCQQRRAQCSRCIGQRSQAPLSPRWFRCVALLALAHAHM